MRRHTELSETLRKELTAGKQDPPTLPRPSCVTVLFKRPCAHSRPTLCDPVDRSPTRLLCPWGFSRQERCSGLPFLSPGDLPDPGIEPASLASSSLAGGFFTAEPPGSSILRGCVWTVQKATLNAQRLHRPSPPGPVCFPVDTDSVPDTHLHGS